MRLGDEWPDFLDEVDYGIDVGDRGEEPEIDHGAAIRRRVRRARLVVIDIGCIGNDRCAGLGDLIEQAPLVLRAAQIDPVSLAIDAKFLAPQLAPVRAGVEPAAYA